MDIAPHHRLEFQLFANPPIERFRIVLRDSGWTDHSLDFAVKRV
jgi:hypothetical protein